MVPGRQIRHLLPLGRFHDAHALYSAVDLIELSVSADAVITIAHDDRLPRPSWLTRVFEATGEKLTVLGRPMTLFTRKLTRGDSLTLGPNTEDSVVKQANMYLVFANGRKTEPPAPKHAPP